MSSLERSVDAAFVGGAALIGPAVSGLVRETSFSVDTRHRRELAEAIERLQPAIAHSLPPQYVEAEAADEDAPEDLRPSTEVLAALSVDTIYDASRKKVQAALNFKLS